MQLNFKENLKIILNNKVKLINKDLFKIHNIYKILQQLVIKEIVIIQYKEEQMIHKQ